MMRPSKNPSLARLAALVRGEVQLAWRQGILALYGLVTAIYILLTLWTAPAARPLAGGVVILSDPAAIGLFFMGAMVLIEKSQRVNCALATSPVSAGEYIAAKVLALSLLGLAVGLIVGSVAGNPLPGVALAVALASPLFTMIGIMLACQSVSLNQFLILSVPVEIVAFTPALFYWFGGVSSPLWLLTPGVAAIVLMGADTGLWLLAALTLLVWDALAFWLTRRVVRAYFDTLGGGKL